MKKHDLLRDEKSIIRVLEVTPDRVLMIDCIKKTMPVWVESSVLESFHVCTGKELFETTGFTIADLDTLDSDQRKTMYDRYTLIAPILPYVSDEKMRSRLISSMATEHKMSKQTIRNYLCLYLIFMDIAALAPNKRTDDAALTQDEKNMRWALNKFFYTKHKNSLKTAYTMMLKEKYCNAMGILLDTYPSLLSVPLFLPQNKEDAKLFYFQRWIEKLPEKQQTSYW